MGLIAGLIVHSADIQDREGAKILIQKAKDSLPRLQLVWADGGYRGPNFAGWVQEEVGWRIEIVKKDKEEPFTILPKRWIVERTFGWLNRYRRLSKDYEALASTAETMILFAMINLMLHRLAPG